MQSTRYHYSSEQPEWPSVHLRVCRCVFACQYTVGHHQKQCSMTWPALCTVCIVCVCTYAYTLCGRSFKMQMVQDGSSSSEKAHTGIEKTLALPTQNILTNLPFFHVLLLSYYFLLLLKSHKVVSCEYNI